MPWAQWRDQEPKDRGVDYCESLGSCARQLWVILFRFNIQAKAYLSDRLEDFSSRPRTLISFLDLTRVYEALQTLLSNSQNTPVTRPTFILSERLHHWQNLRQNLRLYGRAPDGAIMNESGFCVSHLPQCQCLTS
ncbi:hypothetical protein BU16DRAFT_270361 [Lophium mytilinum]|uniref:Uncharacterized protein n=1 Tax=Lophium mytilinum TaxID=390894 RepID=A0A6A6R3W5_9PEZI|nr:hypothetical protein BU16DRAFT_270361 [Lophium mytilinum]